ncbi:hypothetical protein [Pseudomonas fragariae (ex Marin et al. 2024)]|uniref:DUF4348 domain-containing protein n=2 Tax=Pseudomonas fragariae (ex Marin et al. 2024) TaxID=3080056 RepID=A0ABU5BAM5_9PSED|nr:MULTISPECIES: hypothetical protein [unclassified Pseudomonas]MCW6057991.1 hypothetical protein [Pseudomonas fragi]MDV0428080.1 hypothetical protein [Pseudomonas sp. 17]MDX9574437.1 hypothetical protein [Pseudomonas sp. 21(2023)]MDX9588621.1 hypothetical protein [Pseudomonas sp. 19(2023)]MDX9625546.1 hypothetical protein [Pseudomonas sp. 20]
MKINLVLRFVAMISILTAFAMGANAASSGQALCPSKDISKFVDVFAENAAIQKQFTNYPLKKLVTVVAEPEPKQETQRLAKEKISFPVVPEISVRKERRLTLEVIESDQRKATVKLEKTDTGYQVLYVFKLSSCWFLIEVKDNKL